MNTLDKIRAAKNERSKITTILGVPVTLVPISALAGIAISERHRALDGEKADSEKTVSFYVDCIAASATDESGFVFDSDEGRALLRELPLADLQDIGSDAAMMTGLIRNPDEAKKN